MGIYVGIDIGSTTVKVVVMQEDTLLYKSYSRHMSQVRKATVEALEGARELLESTPFGLAISGSAGLGLVDSAGIDFVQEVFATYQTVKRYEPKADVVVELGGEDAKIIFQTGGLEERMNGSCAGGTGAFIDQMASLLHVTPSELDELSLRHTRIYPIASRCGVFAKTDIQPLMNQGAKKEDIAASIFQAVVNQTIAGLSQGRKIEGNVLFLGGPLYFFHGLRQRFKESLNLPEESAIFPNYAQYAVAMGAALFAKETGKIYVFEQVISLFSNTVSNTKNTNYLKPLFSSQQEHIDFINRHKTATVPWTDIYKYSGNAYLGIDCGSTTTKLILMGENCETLYRYYSSNRGNTVEIICDQLKHIRQISSDRVILRNAVATGYGEELVKNAFHLDEGIVETIAHFKAAKHFDPKVEFILDIGGQDIKCFRIKDDAIDSILLNEACSSGCGSFIETFAKSMGYTADEFAQMGLFAEHPVDLGSRCTVFMNSSVKQAQKDGASVPDISAGLSMSVVKNVLYKVIRARNSQELGNNIVVQGGTFLNDAVLRSFEQELGQHVIRPDIAGLMGAYGAAIFGRNLYYRRGSHHVSSMLSYENLQSFTHTSKPVGCKGCTNHCTLTINTFSDGTKYISGNRCEKPLGIAKKEDIPQNIPDLFQYKLEKIIALQKQGQEALKAQTTPPRGTIGLPMGLNMYETCYFWHEFLTQLGFGVVFSQMSSRKLYTKGQYSMPSDTVCYPAKLMHGHMENLLDQGIKTIFYPCQSYNIGEGRGDNHFNCPVVAYYPELLRANVEKLKGINYLYPYFDLNLPNKFVQKAYEYFKTNYPDITKKDIKSASDKAYARYHHEINDNKQKCWNYIQYARKHDLPIIVLAGRPYHIDPEINHGISQLITSLGLAVVTEDCVADLMKIPFKVNVLNQWTYHARLYAAAKAVCENPDMELVQLVSFGCGIDAITTDEVASILAQDDRLYTALKIDEINNLGAVRIRLRSLIGAMRERQGHADPVAYPER